MMLFVTIALSVASFALGCVLGWAVTSYKYSQWIR